jgi:branched-chain amino acid transport system substrate-binding protein
MKKFMAQMAFTFLISFFALNVFAQESIKLTVPLPLTGPLAQFGEIEKRSYEIAMEEINATGGVKDKKILLKFEDSGDNPDISKSIVEELIDVKKQPIVFGEYSSTCSKALAALAEQKKVPYLVVTGAADEITQQHYEYVFRMNPPSAYYTSGLISFLQNAVKPETIAVLYENSEFGSSGAEDMVKQAEKAGIKVLVKEPYARETLDYVTFDLRFVPDLKPILAKVKAAKPDAVYMVSYAMDAVLLVEQIRKLGIKAKLYAGGAAGFAMPEFIQSAKGAAEYVVTTTLWSPRAAYPGATEFAEKYNKRFGEYPSYHGAEAYSALFVVKDVLQRSGSWKSDDIRVAMQETNMMTAFGPIKFQDKEGYTNQNFMDTLVMQVIKGRYEIIWPEKYASAKYVYPLPVAP